MEELNIRLTIDEVNTTLEALGHLPYGRVYQLVVNIQSQAREQLQSVPNVHTNEAAEGNQPGVKVERSK